MNPCECFFSQEMAMRRLLSLLRQSQLECSDSECFDVSTLNQPTDGTQVVDGNLMMYSMIWIAIGFLLYYLRPASIKSSKNAFERRSDDRDDGPGPSRMVPEAN